MATLFAISLYQSYQWLTHKPKMHKKAHHKRWAPMVKVQKPLIGDFHFSQFQLSKVTPFRVLEIKPRVSSEVIWINPKIVQGALIKKGELLIKLDKSDFLLEIEKKEAALKRAKLNLVEEIQKQKRAKEEFRYFEGNITKEDKEFVLRIPYIEDAKAQLKAAKADLELTLLQIKRCDIKAPFDLIVLDSFVALKDVVSPSKTLLKTARADRFLIKTLIEPKKLKYLDQNSYVLIKNKTKASLFTIKKDLDDTSKLAKLIFLLKDPLKREIFLNDFLKTHIVGKKVKNVAKIPRYAIRANNKIWIVKDNRLHIIQKEPLWEDKEFAYISADNLKGYDVVISNLSTIFENMKVRVSKAKDEM